jgi:hypothetical protein
MLASPTPTKHRGDEPTSQRLDVGVSGDVSNTPSLSAANGRLGCLYNFVSESLICVRQTVGGPPKCCNSDASIEPKTILAAVHHRLPYMFDCDPDPV